MLTINWGGLQTPVRSQQISWPFQGNDYLPSAPKAVSLRRFLA